MNRMNRLHQFALTFFILCNIGIAKAQNRIDNLEPVSGIFYMHDYRFEYYTKVRKVLLNGLSEKPEIRFQGMPSFSPEYVLDIEFDKTNDQYFIIFHISKPKISNNDKKWDEFQVLKFKTKIDKASVILIKSLFSAALAQVKYPPPVKEGEMIFLGLDGETFYFFADDKSGTVWSPPKGSKMSKLVAIGNKLIELAQSEKEIVKFDDELKKEITELIDALK